MKNKNLFFPTAPAVNDEIWNDLIPKDHTDFIKSIDKVDGLRIEDLLPVDIDDNQNYIVSYSINGANHQSAWVNELRQ